MTRPKILIVDDEEHIIHVLAMKLRNAGYEPVCAGDGEEALALARRERPALIITDQQMPIMTGLELGEALSEHAQTAGIPVLLLTARGHSLSRDDLRRANIHAVLAKPFSPRAILERIQTIAPIGDDSRTEAA